MNAMTRQPGTDYDVVVAGGGMVGASLAAALGLGPLSVLVVEAVAPSAAASQPSYDERATAISESSRRILDAIGCWQSMAGRAAAIREIHVSERGRFGATRLRAREHGLEAFGHVVENRGIGAALWERLAQAGKVTLDAPARVTAVEQGTDEVRVRVLHEDGAERQVRARLLVAADGARSPVREFAGIDHVLSAYGQSAVIANLTPALDHGGVAYERFTPGGPIAMLPLGGRRASLVWTLPEAEAARVLALDDTAFRTRLQDAFGYRLGRLERIGRRLAYPLFLVQARAWTRGRVVLVGNAAHGIHPVAGQGFNLGLRDAAALAELASGAADPGDPALLAEYAAWRDADRARTVRYTDGLVRVFTSELVPMRVARSLGLVGLQLLPGARAAVSRRGMGLSGRLPRLALGRPLS